MKSTTPWFIDILVDNRNDLQQFLKECGIGSRPMYPPINSQKAYNFNGSFPVSSNVGQNGLWLPSMSQIFNDEITKVTNSIKEFFKWTRPRKKYFICL